MVCTQVWFVNKDFPEVSVVIPTHNRANELSRAMKSALNQIAVNGLEVIVIDDCSSDDTAQVVDSFADARVRYFRTCANVGGSAARNIGIDMARAAVVAFLDDDDTWLPGKLKRQLPLLAGYEAALCGFYVGTAKRVDVLRTSEIVESHLRKRSPAPTSALVVRTERVRALRFDESLPNGQEWDLYMRLLESSRMGYVRAPLVMLEVNRSDSITAAAKDVELADIDQRLRAVGKHRHRLGSYWFRYRYAAHVLMYIRYRNDWAARLRVACKASGLLVCAHVLFDRVLRRVSLKLAARRFSACPSVRGFR